jgi:hypothetical protein
MDLAGSSALSRQLPSDGTASGGADTVVSAQYRDPLPDPASRAATDAAAPTTPAQTGSAALVAGTRGQAKPRSHLLNLDEKNHGDSAARPGPSIPVEESVPPPALTPDLQRPSQPPADERVLTIPDPARDEVRADQERAFAKLAGERGARPSEAGPAAASSTAPGASATADGDVRSELSLLRRHMREQQQQIDQMRLERLAEEQRERADTRGEPRLDAPPAYEGE